MEKFYRLFLNKIKFSYDSFDRIVINGYIRSFHKLSHLSYHFKEILGHGFVNKKILFAVTQAYKEKILAYAKEHHLTCEYVANKVRKESHVEKHRRRFEKKDQFGVYYILKARENESTFRIVRPNKAECDPENYLAKARKPFTQYYFYIHDEILGNMSIRIASYLPFKVTVYLNGHSYIERYLKRHSKKKALYRKRENAFLNIKDIALLVQAKEHFTPDLIRSRINYWLKIIGPKLERYSLNYSFFIDQIEYARNFIFKSHFYLKELFKRSCDLGMLTISNDRIKEVFDHKGKDTQTSKSLDTLEDGLYVFKAHFKRSFIKAYRKFSNFLRIEITSNHLPDLKMKKALEHLPEFREKAQRVLDRYCDTQTAIMNVHADIDYYRKHSVPVMVGQTKIPAIHVYQERINRIMEILLHDHRSLTEWQSMRLRNNIIAEFEIEEATYTRNQIIYDIRKLRAHGIVKKIEGANSYRLTQYGVKVALAFTLMRKRLYGPIHYSLFHHKPDHRVPTESKLERMYRQLDLKLDEIQEYMQGDRAA